MQIKARDPAPLLAVRGQKRAFAKRSCALILRGNLRAAENCGIINLNTDMRLLPTYPRDLSIHGCYLLTKHLGQLKRGVNCDILRLQGQLIRSIF